MTDTIEQTEKHVTRHFWIPGDARELAVSLAAKAGCTTDCGGSAGSKSKWWHLRVVTVESNVKAFPAALKKFGIAYKTKLPFGCEPVFS